MLMWKLGPGFRPNPRIWGSVEYAVTRTRASSEPIEPMLLDPTKEFRMTFYEAAVEVLRRSKRPLHFKKITEVAIRDALLSHVGKTPETTMGERLELEVRRADESIVIK